MLRHMLYKYYGILQQRGVIILILIVVSRPGWWLFFPYPITRYWLRYGENWTSNFLELSEKNIKNRFMWAPQDHVENHLFTLLFLQKTQPTFFKPHNMCRT